MTPLLAPDPARAATPAPDTAPVSVTSDLLGALEVPAASCLTFGQGLYAFDACREFALVAAGSEGLWWLQSREHAGLVFLLADPFHYWPGYAADVPDAELTHLNPDGRVPSADRLLTLVIVTLPSQPGESASANLRAPLVVDATTRRGRQVVLPGGTHGVREPLALG